MGGNRVILHQQGRKSPQAAMCASRVWGDLRIVWATLRAVLGAQVNGPMLHAQDIPDLRPEHLATEPVTEQTAAAATPATRTPREF